MRNDEDYYEAKSKKRNEELKVCLPIIGFCVLLGIILFLLSGCGEGFKRNDPRSVTYREKVSDTDTSEVWRNVTYELTNVSYDTIPKKERERSTLEPEILAPKAKFIPDDRVDLNDYLGDPNDDTDWNYTEIDDEAMRYLGRLGIYWDKDKEYWRKR